jgi:hypothetical protein
MVLMVGPEGGDRPPFWSTSSITIPPAMLEWSLTLLFEYIPVEGRGKVPLWTKY